MNYILVLCLFILSGCGNTVSQDETTYSVSSSQTQFTVVLQSNPTTGYQWVIQHYDQAVLKLLTTQYIPSSTQLMGASGQMMFTFDIKPGVVRPKRLPIEFVYRRSWESQIGTKKTVVIYFLTDP